MYGNAIMNGQYFFPQGCQILHFRSSKWKNNAEGFQISRQLKRPPSCIFPPESFNAVKYLLNDCIYSSDGRIEVAPLTLCPNETISTAFQSGGSSIHTSYYLPHKWFEIQQFKRYNWKSIQFHGKMLCN